MAIEKTTQHAYRPEIDGLRALAVIPVILFHAGFDLFSGGFVGVDIFFVISGYLITRILVRDLQDKSFSIVQFYERRARRILPALFFVLLTCLPFAWLWLFPNDIRSFAASLLSVTLFSSNIYFWKTSGYFDTANELKPLLHTWSLSLEEQFYVIFPLFLLMNFKFGMRRLRVLTITLLIASALSSQYFSTSYHSFNFYLLPTRAWELLLGSLVSLCQPDHSKNSMVKFYYQIFSFIGFLLISFSIFSFNAQTPFPSFYTLIPTVGAAMVIVFSRGGTLVMSILSNKIITHIGLISYSAYLWHQPIFAFARHRITGTPSKSVFLLLSILSLTFAHISWRFIEKPFRNKDFITRRGIFIFSFISTMLFGIVAAAIFLSSGYPQRFKIKAIPKPWDNIGCHGAAALAKLASPLDECLGKDKNYHGGDIFLVGDSHAAQLTFPLKKLAQNRGKNFYFINTEDQKDFPYSFFSKRVRLTDRLFGHVLKVADAGDLLILTFHRGHLNDVRDKHIPLDETINHNEKSLKFEENMSDQSRKLINAGIKIYLIEDSPLLMESNLEKCAHFRYSSDMHPCSVQLVQDRHTRGRQEITFDKLVKKFPEGIFVLDILPVIYGDASFFDPIYADGSYKMFDQHHLTEKFSMELLPFFESSLH